MVHYECLDYSARYGYIEIFFSRFSYISRVLLHLGLLYIWMISCYICWLDDRLLLWWILFDIRGSLSLVNLLCVISSMILFMAVQLSIIFVGCMVLFQCVILFFPSLFWSSENGIEIRTMMENKRSPCSVDHSSFTPLASKRQKSNLSISTKVFSLSYSLYVSSIFIS